MSTADLAVLARACGEIAFRPPGPWSGALMSAVEQSIARFEPNELSDFAWGISRMQLAEPPDDLWCSAFFQASAPSSEFTSLTAK